MTLPDPDAAIINERLEALEAKASILGRGGVLTRLDALEGRCRELLMLSNRDTQRLEALELRWNMLGNVGAAEEDARIDAERERRADWKRTRDAYVQGCAANPECELTDKELLEQANKFADRATPTGLERCAKCGWAHEPLEAKAETDREKREAAEIEREFVACSVDPDAYVSRSVYEQAVKGRQEFRAQLKTEREQARDNGWDPNTHATVRSYTSYGQTTHWVRLEDVNALVKAARAARARMARDFDMNECIELVDIDDALKLFEKHQERSE